MDRAVALAEAEKGPLATTDPVRLRSALEKLREASGGERCMDRAVFLPVLRKHLKAESIALGAPALKALWTALSEREETAKECTDGKGKTEPDTSLRDTENIPFGWAPAGDEGDSQHGETHRDDIIAAYFAHEVKPHVPDAWIDEAKTKTGYEIPFTRHFYKYVPPRPLAEIDADLEVLVAEIMGLLKEVEG